MIASKFRFTRVSARCLGVAIGIDYPGFELDPKVVFESLR
jgi:hypothetical protein